MTEKRRPKRGKTKAVETAPDPAAAQDAIDQRARLLTEHVLHSPPAGIADDQYCASCGEITDFEKPFYGHQGDCEAFNGWWAELEPELQTAVMDRKWAENADAAAQPDDETPDYTVEQVEVPAELERTAALLEEAGEAFEDGAEEEPAQIEPIAADQTPDEEEEQTRLAPGPQVHTYTEKREIDRYLDEADKQRYSDLVMGLYTRRDEVLKEKNAVVAKFAARIKEIDVEIDAKRKAYREGYEQLEVEVEVKIDRLANRFTVRRLDTRQIIAEREVTEDERQLRMFR